LEISPPLHHSIKASQKPKAKGGDRIFGHLEFYWLSSDLNLDRAKEAKIIYYPQYPETRFSGFLRGTSTVPNIYLKEKSGEIFENRLLFLATDQQSRTIGFLAVGHDKLRTEVLREVGPSQDSGLISLELFSSSTSEERLLSALRGIHLSGWHDGMRLKKDGKRVSYAAPNAVGYTLEALLGIIPKGDNSPDFEGYEVKSLTVKNPNWNLKKPVTLLTPEPDLGIYCKAIKEFFSAYGYADKKGKSNRINFGGRHYVGIESRLTGLMLQLSGYSLSEPERVDSNGVLALIDKELQTAAGWSFIKLLDRWKRKHENAVYLQAQKKTTPTIQFRYLNKIMICEGADFTRVLRCLAEGTLYLDPGLKAENWDSGSPNIKRRNQFRVPLQSISELYRTSKYVSLT